MDRHDQLKELLSRYVLKELSQPESEAVEAHLKECQACRETLNHLRALCCHTQNLEAMSVDEHAVESSEQALFRRIENDNKTRPSIRPSLRQVDLWTFIMKTNITRYASAALAAAIILIAIGIWPEGTFTTKVYGISDVPEPFYKAQTIHLKGRIYFPILKSGVQYSAPIESWLDMENGLWRKSYPGYHNHGNERMDVTSSEYISDGEYEILVNHTKKTVAYAKLTQYQRLLFSHRNRHETFLRLYGNPKNLEDSAIIGQEIIDENSFDIWECFRDDTRIHSWIDPQTGDLRRVQTWRKSYGKSAEWAKVLDYDLIEYDTELPDSIFSTDAPQDYILETSKETAPLRIISRGVVSTGHLELRAHISFRLNEHCVLLCWGSEDKQAESSQDDLFDNLEMGGELPKLPIEIYWLEPVYETTTTTDDFYLKGYHLNFTKKDGIYYEWSLYVSNQEKMERQPFAFQELHKYNPPELEGKGRIGLSFLSDITIETSEDFNKWVLGAMAEFSDGAAAPEGITHERVMELVEEMQTGLRRANQTQGGQ